MNSTRKAGGLCSRPCFHSAERSQLKPASLTRLTSQGPVGRLSRSNGETFWGHCVSSQLTSQGRGNRYVTRWQGFEKKFHNRDGLAFLSNPFAFVVFIMTMIDENCKSR